MRVSLAARIVLLFVFLVALTGGAALYQSLKVRDAQRALETIDRDLMPLSMSIAQLESAVNDSARRLEYALSQADTTARQNLAAPLAAPYNEALQTAFGQAMGQVQRLALIASKDQFGHTYIELDEALRALKQHQDALNDPLRAALSQPYDALRDAELAAKLKSQRRDVKVLTITLERQFSRHVQNMSRENDNTTWAAFLLSILAALLAAFAAFFTNYRLKPLKRMTEAAQRLGEGQYRLAVDIPKTRDELGTLAREFEAMRLSILARDRALNEQAEKLAANNRELSSFKVHYETILDNLRFPVVVADIHARIKTVNPAARKLFSHDGDSLSGQPLSDLKLDSGPLSALLDIPAILREGHTQVREALRMGERRLTLSVFPFYEQERIRGLVLIGEDVTDALRVTDGLMDSERNNAADQIGAKVAHEIRNPLSSIALNVELLQEEIEEDEGLDKEASRPLIASILREIERLQTITEAYLKRGRASGGEHRVLDLNTILANLSEFYQAEFNRRGLVLRLDLAGTPALVLGDENQLVRVVHNLIKNAIEASRQGDEIALKSEVEDDRCRLHLADSGPGIPEAIRERIFDPFFTTKEHGTGLGLALARQIVEEHGGTIQLAAGEHGAHFILELQRAHTAAMGND